MISSRAEMRREPGREKGVLLPLFSLPSRYGIGCISKEAYRFVDWLAQTGNTYWQVLPLNPTGCSDSPYQPLSSFAGNAYYIDPEELITQGLLSQEEVDLYDFESDPAIVDYGKLYDESKDGRMEMLMLAFRRLKEQQGLHAWGPHFGAEHPDEEYRLFYGANSFWLEDYAVFMALREEFGRESSWDEWPQALRVREKDAMARARETYSEMIEFYKWTQFEFYREWARLKQYANSCGVRIIGDMPIYVSYDSADCWAAPEQFQLDEDLKQKLVAGVPPDVFAEDGQMWGNPLYDWEKMKKEEYSWWISRIRQSFQLYDVIRLDHFRGYEAYYSVPADAEDARNGVWRKGPGMDLFGRLPKMLHDKFIAEDLGFLTEDVHRLLLDSGFPGMKVLQFAFDGDPANIYLPENYPQNCVACTGTHDNDTTIGWFRSLENWEKERVLHYLGMRPDEWWDAEKVCDLLIEKALESRASVCIIPMQDYLHLDSEARVNVPGTVGSNWCWRMQN